MSYLSRAFRGLAVLGLAAFLTVGPAVLITFAATKEYDAATRAFDIPAGDAGTTLRAFAQQAKREIVFPPMDGVRTNALKGDFTVMAALHRLIAGTELVAFEDGKTGAIVIRREPAPNVAGRRAEAAAAMEAEGAAAGGRARIENGTVKFDDYEVTGSRIRRDPLETNVNPVTVFARTDIARAGVVNIADFIGRITQGNTSLVGLAAGEFPTSGRTTVSLRGLGNNTTLILVNGRRLPKSGQGFSDEGYDLNGIPLGAVERIEILTDGASAIYGSDAIGGVINIITRQNYSGVEVFAQYGNTFDTDVAERTFEVTVGRSGRAFGDRQYSVVLSAGYYDRNALAARDRPYTALSDYSASGGRPPNPFFFGADAGAAGTVETPFDFDTFEQPNLPGFDSPGPVPIPTAQNGVGLTIADFQDYLGGVESRADGAPDYEMLYSPLERSSASLNFQLDLSPRAQFYADAAYSLFREQYTGLPPTSAFINVPATNPFNPFGVPVVVSKTFYELGPSQANLESTTERYVAGLRGEGANRWRYDAGGSFDRYVFDRRNPMPASISFFTPAAQAWLNDPSATTAFNAFADRRSHPPSATELAALRALVGVDDYVETSEVTAFTFNLDGPLFTLPAGDLKVALGGEFRRESVDFLKENTTNSFWISLDEGATRNVSAAFMEAVVPLASESRPWPLVHALQLSAAGRIDSEDQFGEEFTPKFGLLWKPVPSLALRGTYSPGYKVPQLQQLAAPQDQFDIFFGFGDEVFDPVTGRVLDGVIPVLEGGNPDLRPEKSESYNVGLIYEPRGVKNLALSADYFRIDYDDRVETFLTTQDVLRFFPERVRRDPTTQEVVFIDQRAINLSSAHVRGIDAKITYRRETATMGQFDFRLNYTYNLSSTRQTTPTSAVEEQVDNLFTPRVRANADLFWKHRRWELGLTATYEASVRNFLFGAVRPLRVRRAVVFDVQATYDFNEGRLTESRGWTDGLKFTAGILNAFDRKPSNTNGDGGYAKIDPRQRRYYVAVRKEF